MDAALGRRRARSFRIAGWAAAYLLALYAVLASFVPLATVALPAGGATVICHTDGAGDDGAAKGAPAAAHHCATCIVASTTLPPPAAVPVPVAHAIIAPAEWREPGLAPSRPLAHRPGLPRAPPVLA